MLAKTDLKQIGQVVDERLEIKLEEKLKLELEPIKKDLKYLKKKLMELIKQLILS